MKRLLKPNIWLGVGVIFFSFLYLYSLNPYWKITPDSASYVLAAESLAAAQGYHEAVIPPGTSLVLSLFLTLFPGNYFVLNACVKIFIFLALFLFFSLIKKEIGVTKSLAVILFSLGSTFLFKLSTSVVSDIFYMFFSFLALLVIKDFFSKTAHLRDYFFVGAAVFIACMMRIAGLALVFAVIIGIFQGKRRDEGKGLLFTMLTVLLMVFLWEYRSFTVSGWAYVKLFFQKQEWVDVSGYASPLHILKRFFENAGRYSFIGDISTNLTIKDFPLIKATLVGSSLLLLLSGLHASLRKRLDVTIIYFCLYVLFIPLVPGGDGGRYYMPILPLLGYFMIQGADSVINNRIKNIIYVLLSMFFLFYLFNGARDMIRLIPKEHSSPFGSFPVKYSANYDEQALALWLTANSKAEVIYLCVHPKVMNIISGRNGINFPFVYDKKKILDFMIEKNVKFVLIDKTNREVQEFLLPVVREYSKRFILIEDRRYASLYRFQ